MKKILLSTLITFVAGFGFAQTASNFTANDCSGTSHDLFTELNSGKAVVITWVMPCSNCINGALTAQTEVQNALSSNPGKVLYYLSDDVANTSCATLSSWASTNGINSAIIISNSNVKMSDYGATGMPKVVVIGADHKVYYNANGTAVTASGIQNAITTAIAAGTGTTGTTTGLSQNQKNNFSSTKIFPNPSANGSKISLNLLKDSKITIEVQNELGQRISRVFNGSLAAGEHNFDIKTSELANGNYFISFSDGEKSVHERLIVNH